MTAATAIRAVFVLVHGAVATTVVATVAAEIARVTARAETFVGLIPIRVVVYRVRSMTCRTRRFSSVIRWVRCTRRMIKIIRRCPISRFMTIKAIIRSRQMPSTFSRCCHSIIVVASLTRSVGRTDTLVIKLSPHKRRGVMTITAITISGREMLAVLRRAD